MFVHAPSGPIWCCPLQPFYLRYLVVHFWSKILFYFCACYICLRNNFLSKNSKYLWYGRWEHTTADLSWWAWAPFFISNFHPLSSFICRLSCEFYTHKIHYMQIPYNRNPAKPTTQENTCSTTFCYSFSSMEGPQIY